jgi:Peptidase propeptide and YPEB domain
MRARIWVVAAVAAALVLVGAGVAYATGSGEDSSGQAGGANLEKAKSVALEHVNGQVTGTEVGDEEGYYEVEVTKDDGSRVDVHLDKNFEVLGTPADHEGLENKDASDDGGDNSGE